MCGGTDCETRPFWLYSGLSPRVRGNPSQGAISAISDRSIPASAGEPLKVYYSASAAGAGGADATVSSIGDLSMTCVSIVSQAAGELRCACLGCYYRVGPCNHLKFLE